MKQVIWINIAVGFWLVLAAFTQHSQLLSGLRMYNDLTVGVLVLLGSASTALSALLQISERR